jgi:hypothetical protein
MWVRGKDLGHLYGHGDMRIWGKDMGHMAYVDPMRHMAWRMCQHWTQSQMTQEGMFLINVFLVVSV